jgi:hypothetical protein
VITYGCGTWFLPLWEGDSIKVYENMVLRRVSEPGGRKKETAEWGAS